jgi:hypothetical protein
MATIVTLHVYSGVPNPTWVLSSAEESQLEERLRGLTRPAPAKPPGVMGGPGYQGFSITRSAEDARGPLSIFVHQHAVNGPAGAPSLVDESGIEEWLLAVAPAEVDAALKRHVSEGMRHVSTMPSAKADAPERSFAPQNATDAPAWHPTWWDQPDIRPFYNCYNYANNDATHRAAHPGRGGGKPAPVMTCYAVSIAATVDGLEWIADFNRELGLGQGWYVALTTLILNGQPRDHHWYRLDSNG